MRYVSEAAVRIFSPSDDNYPNSGVQPFEGKLSKSAKSKEWTAIPTVSSEFGTGIQFNSQRLTINCWLLTFEFWFWPKASRIPATWFIPSQTQDGEIKNLYPMKLAERIYLAQVNASI